MSALLSRRLLNRVDVLAVVLLVALAVPLITHGYVGLIAQQDTYPLSGKYATTVWAPGRAFLDTYTLNVSADAPIAGDARLVMGCTISRPCSVCR